MMKRVILPILLVFFAWTHAWLEAQDKAKPEEGFQPMFNGKDLTGWINVNCAPDTFFVKDGEIITTGKPTGFMITEKQYENFIAEFEWMHVNKTEIGNSGFFVWGDPFPTQGTPFTRGIEVQVLVNLEKPGFYTSHGDVFSIHGATCKPDRPHPNGLARCLPSENRCKGGGEWNHYRIEAKDGAIKLHVNGKEVSGVSMGKPRKGYLALESEGSECHFRNLRIKEMPSSDPKPEETADVARKFKNLYTGLDLDGWTTDSAGKKAWQPRDWRLVCQPTAGGEATLVSANELPHAEFIADFLMPSQKPTGQRTLTVSLGTGSDMVFKDDGSAQPTGGKPHPTTKLRPSGQWNRILATVKDKKVSWSVNGGPLGETELKADQAKPSFKVQGGEIAFANLFSRAAP